MAQTEATRAVDSDSRRTEKLVDALNDPWRRIVVQVVHNSVDTLSVDKLVTRIVAYHDKIDGSDDVRPTDIRTQLHHRHLPKLGDVGLIQYKETDGTVTAPDIDHDVLGCVLALEQLGRPVDEFDGVAGS